VTKVSVSLCVFRAPLHHFLGMVLMFTAGSFDMGMTVMFIMIVLLLLQNHSN
jgi:hypothetical protein